MVRLKESKQKSMLFSKYVFQFQYGTIKRARQFNGQPILGEFQFQYGTIKRFTPENTFTLNPCFNSNMVRLKESR